MPQANTAYFPFSVFDVVLMGRASWIDTFARPSTADHIAAQEALDTLGIRHLKNSVYSAISGGERQMVLIARALAQEPALIVMDEPTAGLDFGNQARVLEQVRTLAESGLAIVLSTHDPSQAFAYANHVAMMKHGKIVASGTPANVLTPASLNELYGIDVAVGYLAEAGRHFCLPKIMPGKIGSPQPRED